MSDRTRGVPDVAGALPLYAALRFHALAVQSRSRGEGRIIEFETPGTTYSEARLMWQAWHDAHPIVPETDET